MLLTVSRIRYRVSRITYLWESSGSTVCKRRYQRDT
jgi:hypothetical protein